MIISFLREFTLIGKLALPSGNEHSETSSKYSLTAVLTLPSKGTTIVKNI